MKTTRPAASSTPRTIKTIFFMLVSWKNTIVFCNPVYAIAGQSVPVEPYFGSIVFEPIKRHEAGLIAYAVNSGCRAHPGQARRFADTILPFSFQFSVTPVT